jgi:hypothetical protein
MPDKRTHRGPHPDDARLFAPDRWPTLQAALDDLCWLLSRDYAWKSALKIVGDRHELTARQRTAIWRSACSDAALADRTARRQPMGAAAGQLLAVDGYNLLVTIESALSDGIILGGRDGCFRDLASVHGTYRKVTETVPAIAMIGEYLDSLRVAGAAWYLDSPVSNSGRLRAVIQDVAADRRWNWTVNLEHNPDRCLAESRQVVVSTDSWVLDHCSAWVNVARALIESRIPRARVVLLARG